MNTKKDLLKKMLTYKKEIIFSTICLLLFIGLIVYFVGRPYRYSRLEKDSLELKEEKYESYSTTRSTYKIKCVSGNEYEIDSLLVNDELIKTINSNDLLILYVSNKDVMELQVNDTVLLSLEESKDKYHENFKTLLITSLTFTVVIISISVAYEIKMRKKDPSKNIKKELNQEVYYAIQNSIKEENGILKCELSNYVDDFDNTYTFYKAILDYIEEDKIYFMIEDDYDEQIGFMFYKLGLKLYFDEYGRKGDEPFEVDSAFSWYYPNVSATDEAKSKFSLALKEFAENNKDLIKIV